MKRSCLQVLLILLVFANFCNGQSTIIKTQGTNQYANVHCGIQDKAGNLWFGTTGEGIYRYDGKTFINFTEKDGLSNNNVWCIYEDKNGVLWFGTGAGLSCYDPYVSQSAGLNHFFTVPMPESNDGSSQPNEVWSILQDKTGNYWFGASHGVYRYDGKLFTHFLVNDNVVNSSGLHLKHIQSILEDNAGRIWFVSWNREGVSRYDGKSIIRYTRKEGLDDDMVHCILQDRNGSIWVGARNGGVYRYNGAGFIHFTDKEGLGDNCIYSMVEDRKGNIWFATEPGGVWRYDPSIPSVTSSEALTNFTTKDGLGNNAVFSIVSDSSGKLWFGTRGVGLSSYDGKVFTNFSE